MPKFLIGAAVIAAAPFVCAALSPTLAQTRDEIREQQEQLYQQQQEQQQEPQAPAYAAPTAPPFDEDARAPVRSAGGGSLTAQLLDRVSRLEDQVRSLRGRVDELQNQVQTQTAQLNKQIGDMNFAMQQSHAAAPAPAAVPQAAAPSAAPSYAPAVPVHRTPEMALRAANAAIAHRDYNGAADLAREALAGGGPHAVQAQFVLAQALAGQGNQGGAAAAYYTAYTKQPHGPFAPDALLHVGSSLIATGDDNAACEALGQLRAGFPSARPGVLKQAAALRVRAHCH